MEFGSFLTMILIAYLCYYTIMISWEVLGHKTPAKAAVSGKVNFSLAEQPAPVKVTQSAFETDESKASLSSKPITTLEELPVKDDREYQLTADASRSLLEDLGLETITDGQAMIVTEDNIVQLLGEGSNANL